MLFANAAAQAETVTFAGRDVVVAPPASYCALEKRRASDALLIQGLERGNAGRNALLLAFVDCESLVRWRRGEVSTFARWGQVLATLQDGEARPLPSVRRAEMVRAVAQALPHVEWQKLTGEIEDRLAKVGTGVQLESLTPLGVVHRDDSAVYHGLMLPLVLPDASRTIVAGIVALTLVNEVMVTITLYRPFVDQGTITNLLDEQRGNIDALIRANGG